MKPSVVTFFVVAVFVFLVQFPGLDAGADSTAHAATPGGAKTAKAKKPVSVRMAQDDYDFAFQSRDLDTLQRFIADDVVMYEQGGQNIGKDDVLNNHLGPELRSLQELAMNYTDTRIRESAGMAVVTRQISIKGKRQGRVFFLKGSETLGWEYRKGNWQVTHIHMSFPSR